MAIFVTLSVLVLVASLLPHDTPFKNRYTSKAMVFMIIALMIAYIPVLDFYVSDMVRYVAAYQDMHNLSLSQIFQFYPDWEPLFLLTQWFISRFTENQVIYVLFTFLIFMVLLVKAVKNMFEPWQRMFVVFVFFCMPFFHMYVFDGIRQGIAMMFLILAMSYWNKEKGTFKFILCIITAGLFHSTAFIMAIVMLVIKLLKLQFKSLLFIWIVTAMLFVTGLNQRILSFNFLSNFQKIQEYTGSELMTSFGGDINKLSYFAFTLFFLIVSFALYNTIKLDDNHKKIYAFIIKCYIGFSSVFLLFGFVAYSNRIAMYSWFLLPLLVCFPILYKKPHSPALLFLMILAAFCASFIYSPFIVYK